eukprot:gnl/MRDRNA2_/MRDRNA2_55586_c0_seq1.p1 gnl/MRDRNA2_/MRDRNA2_55586_c0~~gnl/MRDRNA2_/MRDRNA2_55586_c0_seq1.p1  ORF type:complete len:232 (-),score=43.12 gnl/MRDRNA2_/MRDRNA2_55586_c0_seq1:96-791(-)
MSCSLTIQEEVSSTVVPHFRILKRGDAQGPDLGPPASVSSTRLAPSDGPQVMKNEVAAGEPAKPKPFAMALAQIRKAAQAAQRKEDMKSAQAAEHKENHVEPLKQQDMDAMSAGSTTDSETRPDLSSIRCSIELDSSEDVISADDAWPEFRPPPGLPKPTQMQTGFLTARSPQAGCKSMWHMQVQADVEVLPNVQVGPPPGLAPAWKQRPLPPWRQREIGLPPQASTFNLT